MQGEMHNDIKQDIGMKQFPIFNYWIFPIFR